MLFVDIFISGNRTLNSSVLLTIAESISSLQPHSLQTNPDLCNGFINCCQAAQVIPFSSSSNVYSGFFANGVSFKFKDINFSVSFKCFSFEFMAFNFNLSKKRLS